MERSLGELRSLIEQATSRDELRGPLQTLALSAATGDEASLELLLATIDRRDLIRPAVRRLMFERADQDDVIQDVLLAVARGIDGFAGKAHVLSWVHRIATNTTVDHLRRRRRSEALDEDGWVPPSRRISSMVTSQVAVRDAIERLPDHYRSAVVLRDIEQLSYAEIAERLDLNLNTTRARIARGRALVADLLGPDTSLGGASA